MKEKSGNFFKKNNFSALLLALTLFFLGNPITAFAVRTLDNAGGNLQVFVNKTGVDKIELDVAAGNVVNRIFYAIGFLFFLLVVYAGIRWMTAKGEEDQITKARETIIAAIIGLVIVVASYAITNLVTQRILLQKNAQSSDIVPTSPDSQGKEVLGCCVLSYELGGQSHTEVRIATSAECQEIHEACFNGKIEDKTADTDQCKYSFWAGERYPQCQQHL